MLENFVKIIKDNNLINKGDKVIVGVSGGADSICLLTLLDMIKKDWDLELIAVNINYQSRGEDSEKDQRLVESYCKELGIKLLVTKYEKAQPVKNIEEEYRNFRYHYFEKIRSDQSVDCIAVAHNQNDQVETMLLFLLRGSGLRGLSAMKLKKGKIIRPLLYVKKEEIYRFLQKKNIEYREDVTNNDIKYTRNKIRHELLPQLAKEYNPNILNTLSLSTRIIADDYEFIESSTKTIYNVMAKKDKDRIYFSLVEFLDLFKSLQREIIRQVFIEFRIKFKDISVLDIDEMLRIMEDARGGSYRVIKGLQFEKKSGSMVISKVNK